MASMWQWEKQLKAQGFSAIAGIDEAGRGALAGPVVAAACILPEGARFPGINDSKQLTAEQREHFYEKIVLRCHYGIGVVNEQTIDRVNILQATFLAMQQAVSNLPISPDYLLIDGNQMPLFSIPKEAIVDGDALSVSIAAASILAKVTRDRMMRSFGEKWPGYGFEKHKGYGTKEHLEAIFALGPCDLHRHSFAPFRFMLDLQLELPFEKAVRHNSGFLES